MSTVALLVTSLGPRSPEDEQDGELGLDCEL